MKILGGKSIPGRGPEERVCLEARVAAAERKVEG